MLSLVLAIFIAVGSYYIYKSMNHTCNILRLHERDGHGLLSGKYYYLNSIRVAIPYTLPLVILMGLTNEDITLHLMSYKTHVSLKYTILSSMGFVAIATLVIGGFPGLYYKEFRKLKSDAIILTPQLAYLGFSSVAYYLTALLVINLAVSFPEDFPIVKEAFSFLPF